MRNSAARREMPPARLYLTNTSTAVAKAELPCTGKYWGRRYGNWVRVEVTDLPKGGGTGCLVFAPRDRRGYPWHNSGALQNCQVLWGPVASWGTKEPWVPKTQLKALGVL